MHAYTYIHVDACVLCIKLDFWTEPKALGMDVDIMVGPGYLDDFQGQLHQANIAFSYFIENVQEWVAMIYVNWLLCIYTSSSIFVVIIIILIIIIVIGDVLTPEHFFKTSGNFYWQRLDLLLSCSLFIYVACNKDLLLHVSLSDLLISLNLRLHPQNMFQCLVNKDYYY